MKEKTKTFLKEHKALIIGATCLVAISGACVITVALLPGKTRVVDTFVSYTKEGVIKFLQEMTDPSVKYAIFKETTADVFQIVQL